MQMRVDSLTEVTGFHHPPARRAAARPRPPRPPPGSWGPPRQPTTPVTTHTTRPTTYDRRRARPNATPPRNRTVPMTLISQASVAAGSSPVGQLSDLGAGFSQVKKGFNSFLSSIDSALKSPDDQSDTMSVMSDMSSDSDSYVLLNLEMDRAGSESVDPLFVVEGALKRVPSVEIASEVTEDTHSEVSLSSAMRKRDVISALTLRLGRVEFVQQGAGFDSSVKVLLRHLSAEQCAAIGWDEFQAKFQLRTKGWQGLDVATEPCNIRMRMDSTFVPVAGQRHHKINVREQVKSELEVRASDLDLGLMMSTVANLTDFIEDEILPVPLPIELHLERLKVRLTEDRPPNNITSPGVVPLDLSIPSLRVTRDKEGVFTVHQTAAADQSGNPCRPGDASTSASRVDVTSSFNNPGGGGGGGGCPPAVVSELARLRQRCQLLENQLEQRRGAEERLQYLSLMETRCREAEDEAQGLREEKESLMKTLRYLQEEFLRLDRAQNRRADPK
ncbi:UHRF1-binding protein 1 [Amphibalanus amphitrite]|uniref:UHRF1-binding protein 1 n=1 Tax=Amphibalanus amphitrite TaxID=1232801 RepID=A0A6A4VJK6_AMPAM|nr:UHRF1-binding protein 1 [Amphibalanus amphitrite]